MDALTERFPSHDVFGAKLTPTTSDDLLAILDGYIGAQRQCVIASQNMHGLRVRQQDAAFERLHRLPDTFVHLDGMPLVLLCRLRGIAATRAQRVTLVDWIWPLLEHADARGWRVFYLGAAAPVLSDGLTVVRERLPNLALNAHHGYITRADGTWDETVTEQIAAFRPDIVLVGMGMGRQESWILAHLEALAPASIVTVGACIEYVAGAVKTPPRWMGRTGLEWFFRLAEDPKRFWHRYLIEPWFVLGAIVRSSARR